jgi:hypothetical protein
MTLYNRCRHKSLQADAGPCPCSGGRIPFFVSVPCAPVPSVRRNLGEDFRRCNSLLSLSALNLPHLYE